MSNAESSWSTTGARLLDRYSRVNVTRDAYGLWDDTVCLTYVGGRVLEDDIVRFVGTYTDVYTYESTGAGRVSVPSLDVVQLVIE